MNDEKNATNATNIANGDLDALLNDPKYQHYLEEILKNQDNFNKFLQDLSLLPNEKKQELLKQISQLKQQAMESYAHSFLGYMTQLEYFVALGIGLVGFVFVIYFVFLRTSKNKGLVDGLKAKLKLKYFYYTFAVLFGLFFILENIKTFYELFLIGSGSVNDKVSFVLKNICFIGAGCLFYKIIKVIGLKNFINSFFAKQTDQKE
ncbi:hypothetical protein HMPREF1430_00878 [Helicobacter pylori GAM96Ai]|uniref:hypothetical protein n=1 Tax=Helicobacter pylori TaxID=210 RepID=UPI0002BC464D|nr:hypothetical protein [Helicobacter pylori]EMH42835.1 hypothetical protein HMPREF1430_00878 [Helicobacter pylori GAM96Ai]